MSTEGGWACELDCVVVRLRVPTCPYGAWGECAARGIGECHLADTCARDTIAFVGERS